MRTRTPLPARLGERFAVHAAAAAGVGRSRRDAADLDRPFHGIRARHEPTSFRELVDCYLPRLKRGHRFGGRTAMRLWGLPFPVAWTVEEPLEVIVPPAAAPPQTARVKGSRLADHRAHGMVLTGVPVVDPVAALFSCAPELTVQQAVIVIDAVVTTASNYPELGPMRPMTTLGSIEARLAQWGRFPGCGTIRAALPLARELVESPKESETRLIVVGAGLPEPIVQFEVREGARLVARVDLAYPEWKIAIEYEGDGHRADREQWRRDIQRQRELEARGWIVIRLTQEDLHHGGAALLPILRRAIALRSR